MTFPTVAVTVDLYSMLGVAYEGVTVSAKLDKNDRYADGFVIAETVEAVTDSSGRAVLHLFPNNPTTGLGTTGSVYTFRASPKGGKNWKATAQIPNVDCNLDDVADSDIVEGVGAAAQAQANAQASAIAADVSAGEAADSAQAAQESEDAAWDSRVAARSISTHIGATPPVAELDAPLVNGREWFNTTNGKTYTYYDDGTSAQWVEPAGFYYVDDAVSVSAAAASASAASTSAGAAAGSASAAAASQASASASAVTAQGSVSQVLGARRLRELLESWYPIALLPQKIVIEKLRADYPEFAVYTPVTSDGIEWARWLITNRFNVGNSGSPRMNLCGRSLLYTSVTSAPYAENMTTGTEGQAPLSTQATTAAGSRTGAWTGPAVVGGFADIIYSTTVGDKAIYTSGASAGRTRLVLRLYRNSGNGGIGKVTVKQAGVEIAAGLYCVPQNSGTDRTIDLKQNDGAVTGIYYVPVADGLDPALPYTVELEVHSTNPAGGRLYDGGLREYAAIAANAVGRHGTFRQVSMVGTNRVTYDGGSKAVYQFTGTKIVWNYIATQWSGIANLRVLNGAGVQVATLDVDAHSGVGSLAKSATVASGLPNATYYLHVTAGLTKNASAAGYRMYDEGAVSYNETQAGVPGTDTFDNLGLPSTFGVLDGTTIPDGTMFIGTGNLELAIRNRRTTDSTALASSSFSGGTHGHESAPSGLAYTLDGSALDFAGGAVGQKWVGSRMKLSFTTSLQYGTGTGTVTDTWADVAQELRFSPRGYSAKVTRTVTATAMVYDDYTLMLMAANGTGAGGFGNKGCGGPFQRWALDSSLTYTVASNNNGQTNVDVYSRGVVTYNDSYGIYGYNSNESDARAPYAASDATVTTSQLALIQDRADKAGKYYNRAFRYDAVNGRQLNPGDSITRTNHYRVVKLPAMEAMLAS